MTTRQLDGVLLVCVNVTAIVTCASVRDQFPARLTALITLGVTVVFVNGVFLAGLRLRRILNRRRAGGKPS